MIGRHGLELDLPVPTHVGVNLHFRSLADSSEPCPHARGGEPHEVDARTSWAIPVPTHVGVNLS